MSVAPMYSPCACAGSISLVILVRRPSGPVTTFISSSARRLTSSTASTMPAWLRVAAAGPRLPPGPFRSSVVSVRELGVSGHQPYGEKVPDEQQPKITRQRSVGERHEAGRGGHPGQQHPAFPAEAQYVGFEALARP